MNTVVSVSKKDLRMFAPTLQTPMFRLFRVIAAWTVLGGIAGTVGAHQVRLDGLPDPGYNWSRSWVDFNNDGRDDYCHIAGADGERLECYPSKGTSFGLKQVFGVPASKDPSSVHWADVNGDGQIDLCRVTGSPQATVPYPNYSGTVVCAKGPTFAQTVSASIPLRWTQLYSQGGGGYSTTQHYGLITWRDLYLADVNADGKSDACYVHENSSGSRELRCLLSNGSGFDAHTSSWTRTGLVYTPASTTSPDWPRGFYDFNGDGYGDFCRVASGVLRCTLGSAAGFTANDVVSSALSLPIVEGAAFVDLNGDGNTDFCRLIGTAANYSLSCKISNGIGWEATERTSPVLNQGDGKTRWWVDINADGLPDFCRATDGSTFSCRLARGDGDGSSTSAFAFSEVSVSGVNFGRDDGGRGFCDVLGVGVSTYCRATYTESAGQPQCYTDVDTGAQTCWPTTVGSNGISAGLVDGSQAQQSLLTAFTDGVGAETRVNYLPMTNPDVYTRSGVGADPQRVQIVQPRAPVVFETRAWKTGTQEALTGNARYFYSDLRNDTFGGSRGFRERWIFTEGSNTLDHVVFFQGLGPSVDATSIEHDSREIGLVKYQERFAVANGVLPTPLNTTGLTTQRQLFVQSVVERAKALRAVPPGPPTAQSPFYLLQSTVNTLSDTSPINPRFRYVGASTVKSWDLNGSTQVALPQVDTTTVMSDLGNVTGVVQTTGFPGGAQWKKTTTNVYGQDDTTKWILGRLTKSTVTSEAPTVADQIAAYPRNAGRSSTASDMSSSAPAVAQPLSPAVLSAILQLLLED